MILLLQRHVAPVWHHTMPGEGGIHPISLVFAIGIYYDRCVEQDGRWRFAWHHYQSYYNGPGDLSGNFRPMIDYGAPFDMPAPDEPSPMAGTGNI